MTVFDKHLCGSGGQLSNAVFTQNPINYYQLT